MADTFHSLYLEQLNELVAVLPEQSDAARGLYERARTAAPKLERYCELLLQWNDKTDLVGEGTLSDMVRNHFIDSVAGLVVSLNYLNQVPGGIIDVGSGAGFPGLVWAMLLDKSIVKLVEPRKKRVAFLQRIVSSLGLKNVQVAEARIEAVEEDLEVDFSFAVCRALGIEDEYLGESRRVLSTGGMVSAMVGPSWSAAEKEVDEPVERIDYELCAGGPKRSVVFW